MQMEDVSANDSLKLLCKVRDKLLHIHIKYKIQFFLVYFLFYRQC